jgi:DNA-binding HxlR family transcriptional regulator
MPLPKRSPRCAFESLLTLLTGAWTLYILWVLRNNGPTRFGELRRKVQGVSARILTDRLRLLEEAQLVYRDYQPTIPPKEKLDKIGQPSLVLGLELLIFRSWQAKRATY